MEREREVVGNKFGETKGEEQTRINDEALRRAQGDFPVIGGPCTQQSQIIVDRRVVNDASLNGDGTLTVGWQPEAPFDETLNRVTGSVGKRSLTTTAPPATGLTSAPLCVASSSGSHMNTEQILKKGK